jgi:hypothetical protein
MPFWVHGRDAATGQPRDSLFIETESEADARQQAAEAGLTVEEVEHVHADRGRPGGGHAGGGHAASTFRRRAAAVCAV